MKFQNTVVQALEEGQTATNKALDPLPQVVAQSFSVVHFAASLPLPKAVLPLRRQHRRVCLPVTGVDDSTLAVEFGQRSPITS